MAMLSYPLFFVKLNHKTNFFVATPLKLNLKPINSAHSSTPSTESSPFNRAFQPISCLNSIKPFVLSQWKPILEGWLCSAISVYSLSKIVPRIGKFSAVMGALDATSLRDEGLGLGLWFLVRLVANYMQQSLLWDAALNSAYNIRVYVYERVLQRDLRFFEGGNGVPAGDIAYRITAEASDVADTICSLLNTIVPSTLQLSAMASQMLVISPVLTLISAFVIPSMAVVIAYLGEKLRQISKSAHLSTANLSSHLNEVLPLILFVKANNTEICESDVGKAYNEFKQGEPAIERLFDLTRFKYQVIERPDAVDLECVRGEVKFCGVSFKYGENMPLVLNGLDLHIKAGETVALVGPSGGGKTTLVKLLLRLYDPLCGCICIDGHNIQNVRLESLRKHVGLVSQDIMLFSGSVAENIGYRDLIGEIDMERVKFAAQTANADEFIERLPEGYGTNIGPRGSTLSGGQRQRLAIARALYQNPSILILDEATSALDSRSELLVRQAVQRLMEDRTVMVIAHHLETVLSAERVLLLDNGRLQELTPLSGTESFTSAGLVI